MRRNTSRHVGTALAFLTCLFLFAACSLKKPIEFRPEDVSCTDLSTPEAKAEIESEDHKKHKFFKSHEDPVFDAYVAKNKTLADQGWAHAMNSFGTYTRGRIQFLNRYDEHQHTNKTLPEEAKDEMVLGLTYIYLAANIDSPYRGNALWMLDLVEANNSFPKTPPEWIQKAKINAERWIVHCHSA